VKVEVVVVVVCCGGGALPLASGGHVMVPVAVPVILYVPSNGAAVFGSVLKFVVGNSAVFGGFEESVTLKRNGPVIDGDLDVTTGAVPVIVQLVDR
jgi:hypothetical protein